MKRLFLRNLCVSALAAMSLGTLPALGEDIDLFTAGSGGPAPNVLIVLDNSANWNRNDQAWPGGKQGQSELQALAALMDAHVNPADTSSPFIVEKMNLGLMMFSNAGTTTGAYVRYHIRGMSNPANRAAFKELILGKPTGTACPSTNSITGGPNCILANFSSATEETNAASTIYEAALWEAFHYFGGYTDPAHAFNDSTPTPYITDATHFGNFVYAGPDPKADPAAFTDGSKTRYNTPFNADGSDSCAKNFIIFIGNGYPSQVLGPTLLTNVNGNPAVPGPIGNKANLSASYSHYLFLTDMNAVPGRQNAQIFTLDAYLAHQDLVQTSLLQAMAGYAGANNPKGGGQYFPVHSTADILAALENILINIQAVNSVFASASLPINATNRSQNANQVYIGMFRPDPKTHPRWFGNLKQYQIVLSGNNAVLGDSLGNAAVSTTTGFLQPCAQSFWTKDSGSYWAFSPASAGTCSLVPNSSNSDLPDGAVVEKGGAAEVVRRGNNPSAVAPFTVSRTMYTESASFTNLLVPFSATTAPITRTGATATTEQPLIDYTLGKDVNDENLDTNLTEPRPSIHGDIAHSRPLPVNYGGTRGVVIYYGANDGPFRAIDSATGKELWSFIAPEHHSKLLRLFNNSPDITYPNVDDPNPNARKDYFFDGASGIFQNADNSKVWIYPTMRRGGRMLYAFDVTTTTPSIKWSFGCPDLADDLGCSTGASGIGQTWSGANVGFAKGYNSGNNPIIVMGGGYDACEDADTRNPTCTVGTEKGAHVYVIDADTGAIIRTFDTDRAVPGDVTLVDRDFDGKADHAYVGDTGGNLYRIDFVDPATIAARPPGSWTITKVASTTGAGRKFLFGPSALALSNQVIIALGSGDRERPLISNYPYTTPVLNRFYTFFDSFSATTNINLDGPSMANFTTATDCNTVLANNQTGWFMDLAAGTGEQTVTSSVIFGGTVFWSTNRPVATQNVCSTNLGEARGYAVNVLNASGVVGTGGLCGGSRSGAFTGGGLPPSPVIGIVPVKNPDGTTRTIPLLIGGIDLTTGSGSPIGAQQPPVPIKQKRSRVYWYPQGDK
ncbi:MAG TPA: PilC/PilY family type IV pilus protein [Usitatibacter sp.]|nr:PilC/PilY family type IV pilus protein [Usitatibacter sp.]